MPHSSWGLWMFPNIGHFTQVPSCWPWSCGCRYSCCLGQHRTGCGLGDQCDSFSLQCKLGTCPWPVRSCRRKEGERAERGLQLKGLLLHWHCQGLTCRQGRVWRKTGGYWRGCSHTGAKKLRRKLIKWVIENYCNFLLKRIKVNSPSVQLARKHVNSYHSYVGKEGEIEG